MTIEQVDCQPCRVVAETASLMRVRAESKGLSFSIEYIGRIPETIQSDPTRLRQILINLIGNAIKFTEEGAVRLLCRYLPGDEPRLQFDVIDTGCGISDEQMTALFRPFVQADNSTTRKFGGTGLGLTISKRFAQLLGGDVTIPESVTGVGSTFRLVITTGPLRGVEMLDDPMMATVASDASTAMAPTTGSILQGIRILLVEDCPAIQHVISSALKRVGADLAVEENGKLAIDAALAARDDGKPFDVILMDMQMPIMGGYQATTTLRRKDYAGLIIAVTAHAMEGDREKCISAGCDDYATKPVDRRKLIDLIFRRVQERKLKPETDPGGVRRNSVLTGCRILLAEDNPTSQVLVVRILEKAGAKVTPVKDGKLALVAAQAAWENPNPFDIILMDIQMPLLGGDEATRILREKGYSGKIIALTANATDGDRQRYISMGFDACTWKPINRTQLIETIQRHLEIPILEPHRQNV